MAWASAVNATQLTSITTEQFFSFAGSTNVTLNPGESAHCQVTSDPPTTPTDNLVVSVYASPDDGTTYDVTPFIRFHLDKASDPNRASFIVSGVESFRIGVMRSGTTDTYTDADATHRKNGISV